MRRKEREIIVKDEIFDVLKRCNTIRIAINGEQFPYVVPVSFGMEVVDDNAIVYFHCAKEGMKLNLLNSNPNVCVEADIYIKTEKTEHGITTRYESVIGFGQCIFVNDTNEIIHGLRLITEHYGYNDYPLEKCAGLQHLQIGKIVLSKITGKKIFPDQVHQQIKCINKHCTKSKCETRTYRVIEKPQLYSVVFFMLKFVFSSVSKLRSFPSKG